MLTAYSLPDTLLIVLILINSLKKCLLNIPDNQVKEAREENKHVYEVNTIDTPISHVRKLEPRMLSCPWLHTQ